MEKIKLAFSDADFRINHKKRRIRCVLDFQVKGDQKTLRMLEAFTKITNDPIEGRVVVDVTPSKDDEFCVDTGCKVARARAEKAAYRRMAKFFGRFATFVRAMTIEIGDFNEKAYNTIEHNDNYMKQF